MTASWFKNPFGHKVIPPIEKKAAVRTIPLQPGSFLEFALSGAGRLTAQQAMSFYNQNSAIATAVDLIAGSFEQIKPVLQMEDGSFDDSHEVLSLLSFPNGFQTYQEIAGQISRHYLIKHDSHITGLGSVTNPPIELWAAKPQNVSVQEDFRDGFPFSYQVSNGAGKGIYAKNENAKIKGVRAGTRFYDSTLKELYHIMGFSSRANNIEGDSPLEAAALEAKQQIEGKIHNLKMLRNGGRLSLVFAFKDDDVLTEDQHRERKDRINDDLAGSNNAGKIAVISGSEVDVNEFGKTNKDMDYAKLEQAAAHAIYLRLNVPLPLISNDASTFNNLQTAITYLYDFAVLPLGDIVFAGLSKMLLPRYGLDISKVRITYDPESITALKTRRLAELKARKELGIETTNELREGLPGRDPVTGGDVVMIPANFIPLGFDIEQEEEENETDEEKAARLLKRDGVVQ